MKSSLLFWILGTDYLLFYPNLKGKFLFYSICALSSCLMVPSSHTACEFIYTAVFSQKENTSYAYGKLHSLYM